MVAKKITAESQRSFHIDLSGMTNEKGDSGIREKLIREYGDAAYQKAQEAVRNAHRRRNGRLERFLEKVASEIARRAPAHSTAR